MPLFLYTLFQTLDRTMGEDTVFWDLNYAMKYKSLVSENILKKVLKVSKTRNTRIDLQQNTKILKFSNL